MVCPQQMAFNSAIPILKHRILRFKERSNYGLKSDRWQAADRAFCIQVSVARLLQSQLDNSGGASPTWVHFYHHDTWILPSSFLLEYEWNYPCLKVWKMQWSGDRRMQAVRGKFKYVLLAQLSICLRHNIYLVQERAKYTEGNGLLVCNRAVDSEQNFYKKISFYLTGKIN